VDVAVSLSRSFKADTTKIIENQSILLGRPTIFPDFYFLDGLPDSLPASVYVNLLL